jgi:anti-sigma B factor antagonist
MFDIELSVREPGGPAVVTLRGDLDLASTPAVASHLLTAVAACGPSVIVDLAGLDYICQTGLGILVRVREWVRESGGVLSLAAPQAPVREVLQITGLADVFSVYPSVEQAFIGLQLTLPPTALVLPRPGAQPVRAGSPQISYSGERRVLS